MRGSRSVTDPFPGGDEDALASVDQRRRRFLKTLNWGWLGMGTLALVSLPFYPGQRSFLYVVVAATVSTFLGVRVLMSRGRSRLAAGLYTVLVDLAFFLFFLVLARETSLSEGLRSETPSLMMMGLAVLFAGALLEPRAPFLVAIVNSILLATIVMRAGSEDPRFSIHIFWWLLALVAWLYERTLGDAFSRLDAGRKNLQGLVDQRTAELRESVRRLSKAMDDLETSNRELDAFASAVSHDLRAPVRSVIGFTEALYEEQGDRLDSEGLEHLSRVRRAGRRMNALIDDLLRLSRVARPELKVEEVDLGIVAGNVLEELRRSEPGRNVLYQRPETLLARGDARLLQVLLENLIANAWKFTRPRSEARIELGELERNGERVYFVRDNGVGFDMSYAEKLFRPFQRLHSSEEFDGTGIGLATAQRIVRRHGGRIWAEAVRDEGAAFYFVLDSRAPAEIMSKRAAEAG
jgi:signal transduction histidine kinase